MRRPWIVLVLLSLQACDGDGPRTYHTKLRVASVQVAVTASSLTPCDAQEIGSRDYSRCSLALQVRPEPQYAVVEPNDGGHCGSAAHATANLD